MKGTEEVKKSLIAFLTEQKLPAMAAWPEKPRCERSAGLVVVSLVGLKGIGSGFQDYLGECYDPVNGWTERYGKRVELTFGLDLYGPTAEKVSRMADQLGDILFRPDAKPAGLRLTSLLTKETQFSRESGRYCCPVQAVFEAWAVGSVREDGTFTDFEVRGVTI